MEKQILGSDPDELRGGEAAVGPMRVGINSGCEIINIREAVGIDRETVGGVGREIVDCETADRETVGCEIVGRETVGRETLGRETVARETVARETVGQAVTVGRVGREIVGREKVGRETVYHADTKIVLERAVVLVGDIDE